MTKEYIFDIALKIFGIYCVVATIRFFLALGPLFISKSEMFWKFYTSKTGYLISQIPYPLVHLILAFIFLFRTQWLIRLVDVEDSGTSEVIDAQSSGWVSYSFWIKILGLYYFVSSAAAIAASAVELVVRSSGFFHIYRSRGSFLTDVLILLLSLFLIFKTKKVEKLIAK